MRQLTLAIAVTLLGSYACSTDKKFEGSAASKAEPKVADATKSNPPANNTPVNDTKLPEPAPTPVPNIDVPNTTVEENTIEFGADEVFHIGDGNFAANTACASEIRAFDLSGNTFSFQFEVEKDDTEVELTIGKICGVDGNADSLALLSATKEVVKNLKVPTDRSGQTKGTWAPFPAVKLAKGKYTLQVASGQGGAVIEDPFTGIPFPVGNEDFDDFLIGKINLKANKPVKALGISAE